MNIEQSISQATAFIHSMYQEPITIADIAEQVFLSPSYFSFIFRTMSGYTVKNYLNQYRLYRAAMDLYDSRQSIVAIAYTHGFSSQQAFTRSFTQMYGMPPGKFRLQNPPIELSPPKTIWKGQFTMELAQCFDEVRFIHKDTFFVVGLEVDINYHTAGGTYPISGAWQLWNENKLRERIPNQTNAGVVYGITHSETAEDTGKYTICVEVTTLDNLPVGLVGRRFDGCDCAVFNTTCAIIETGDFWRTFYTKWLPQSQYEQPDESLHDNYCTFNKYPAIEVYGRDFVDKQSVIQIYAPVVKKS